MTGIPSLYVLQNAIIELQTQVNELMALKDKERLYDHPKFQNFDEFTEYVKNKGIDNPEIQDHINRVANNSPMYDTIIEQMKREEAKRKNAINHDPHPTTTIIINNNPGQNAINTREWLDIQQVEIDKDMTPIIQWMQALHIKTFYCCQGDTKNNKDFKQAPYVIWTTNDDNTLKYITKIFNDFHKHSEFKSIRHEYHKITTEVEFYEENNQKGITRYITKWYDNISLNEFTQWNLQRQIKKETT